MNGEENIDLTAKQQSQDQQTSSNRITITVITINGTELEEADLTSQQQSQKLSNNTSVTKNQELDKRKRKLYKCLKILLLSVFAVIGVSVLLVPSMIYYFPLPLRDGDDANGNQSNTSSVIISRSNCSTLRCQEGFSCSAVGNTSLCLPVCGRWAQYSHGTVVAIDVAVITSAAIGVIASIAVLVISCIRWEHMFTFPSVFVVYTTITVTITAVFALISHVDRKALYCVTEYLSETQSTFFCTLSGIVFYYGVFQVAVWWFCHVVSLFWGIQFPFHFRSFKAAHRQKYIYIPMVIVGLVLPALPVIVTFTAGEPSRRGFGLSTFPPTNCDSLQSAPASFYSLVLPVNLILVTGIPLLVIIFWIIHKQHGLLRVKMSKHSFQIGTAQRKLLIILCYYVLLAMVALTGVSIPLRNAEQLTNVLTEYWQCEAAGIDPENPCNRASVEQQSNPALITISYVLLWIFPAVNLIFAINIREIRQKFKTWSSKTATPTDSSSDANAVPQLNRSRTRTTIIQ